MRCVIRNRIANKMFRGDFRNKMKTNLTCKIYIKGHWKQKENQSLSLQM